MPEMKGPEVARAILGQRPGLPVLYMTGYVGSVLPSANAGQFLLQKPFSISELAAKMQQTLSEKNLPKTSDVSPLEPGPRV